MTVVTRIAPSPTGDPHVGTAYIGLFNYALARHFGGRFILRIEDTDQERYDPGSEVSILDAMDWLGLTPDESPRVGGPHAPYRQSERLELYRAEADRLIAEGSAYRAFETAAELAAIREEQKRLGQDPGYDGRGRSVSAEESAARARAGEPFVVRLRIPDGGATTFTDTLRGEITIQNRDIRDPVLMKSDGYPTYHLANVIDDHFRGVTHVIRAEEWITSTPIHVLLYQAFGWDLPRFTHMPLLRNPDRNKTKISKRKLDTSILSYRQQGIVPEALLNFLGNMGWSMPDGQEFFSVQQMIDAFDLSRVSLGGPVFDLKKLRHFNAKYLRELLTLEDVAERTAPLLRAEGFEWEDDDYLLDVIDLLRPRAETLRDFVEQSQYFFVDDYEFSDEALKSIAAGQTILGDLERELSMLDVFDYDSVDELLRDYVQRHGLGMGRVMMPMRAALTGSPSAPGVTDIASILGRQQVLARIGRALQSITAALPDDNPQKALDQQKALQQAADAGAGRGAAD
jgi:glutamyl-tRNA synthetase